MYSFQKFIVVSFPTTLPPVVTRIWKLAVRADGQCIHISQTQSLMESIKNLSF